MLSLNIVVLILVFAFVESKYQVKIINETGGKLSFKCENDHLLDDNESLMLEIPDQRKESFMCTFIFLKKHNLLASKLLVFDDGSFATKRPEQVILKQDGIHFNDGRIIKYKMTTIGKINL